MKHADEFRVYIDNTQLGSTQFGTNTVIQDVSSAINIGAREGDNNPLDGQIQFIEIILNKSVADVLSEVSSVVSKYIP
jgi:hypothetical protein